MELDKLLTKIGYIKESVGPASRRRERPYPPGQRGITSTGRYTSFHAPRHTVRL
jgi:hypothetical protein